MKINRTDEGNKNRKIGKRKYFDNNKIAVYQYDLKGNFLKKWDSAVDAGLELNISNSNITKVCKKLRNMAGNFIWSYKRNDVSEYNRRDFDYKRSILQKEANDNIINKFASVIEASKTLNILNTAILNCLKGRTKSAGGFKWEYINTKNKTAEGQPRC